MHARLRLLPRSVSPLQALWLVLVVVCWISSCTSPHVLVEGVSLRLESKDFILSHEPDTVKRIVGDKRSPSQCLLMQLADDTPEVTVEFGYTTTMSNMQHRLPLVITMHEPASPYAGHIDFHDTSKVMESVELRPSDLVFADNIQQSRDRKRKRNTVTLKAKWIFDDAGNSNYANYRRTQGEEIPGKEPIPGAYGLCFSLDRQALGPLSYPNERVHVEVLDVFYHHNKRVRRPGGKTASRLGGWFGTTTPHPTKGKRSRRLGTSDADNTDDASSDIFESTVRKLYKAKEGEDVNAILMNDHNLVSSAELQRQLESVDEALRKMQRIQDLTMWQRERELDMRKTTESTFTRVWVATAVLLAGIAASLYITFTYTKLTIVKRKLL